MKVIVIGAGIAGLACAAELKHRGHDVLVVEARDRIGGRIYAAGDEAGGKAELGGAIIHGINRNPLTLLAVDANLGLKRMRKCILYDTDGRVLDRQVDRAAEALFNELLERADERRRRRTEGTISPAKLRDQPLQEVVDGILHQLKRGRSLSPEESRALNWHCANIEFACGATLSELSHLHWDQDDPNEFKGDHCMVETGLSTILSLLARDLNVRLNAAVDVVSYDEEGVKLELKDGSSLSCDAVVCTVPLGVLKANCFCTYILMTTHPRRSAFPLSTKSSFLSYPFHVLWLNKPSVIKFRPALPQDKLLAIRRLGYGVVNKIVLRFDTKFWDDSADFLGYTGEKKGLFFLFMDATPAGGSPTLSCILPPGIASQCEGLSDQRLVLEAMAVLRTIARKAPDPVSFHVTRWGRDEYARGSYSFLPVGSSGEDYEAMGRPVAFKGSLSPSARSSLRLLFAGEATIKEYPSTAHGAFLSGIREARRLDGEDEETLVNLKYPYSFILPRNQKHKLTDYDESATCSDTSASSLLLDEQTLHTSEQSQSEDGERGGRQRRRSLRPRRQLFPQRSTLQTLNTSTIHRQRSLSPSSIKTRTVHTIVMKRLSSRQQRICRRQRYLRRARQKA